MASSATAERTGGRQRRWLLLGAAATAVLAVLLAVAVTRDEPVSLPPLRDPARYESQVGRYAISYPAGWTATSLGNATKLTPPGGDAIIGLAPAPKGGLERSASTITKEVLRSYDGVRVLNRTTGPLAGKRAVIYVGRGRNLTRTPIRWMTITVKHGDRNFAWSVFTERGADPQRLIPSLEAIISSLEPL